MRAFLFDGLTKKRCSRLHENACFLKMVFSCRRKHLFHDCMFNMLFSLAGHWKPMVVKNPWGNKENKQTKCGDQWELENHWEIQKTKNNKMWTPMGVKNHWEIQKKQKKQNVETYGPGPNHRSPHLVFQKLFNSPMAFTPIGLHILCF